MTRAVWPGARRKRVREVLFVVAWAAGLLVVMCFWLVSSAIAHMAASGWACPVECCSGHDCDVIASSRVSPAAGGFLVDGKFFVAARDARQSPDGVYHGCFPTKQTIGCFWAPPQGS